MDAFFNFLNQGWVGIAIGLVVAIITTALSVHFYRRSRQGAQLAYHHWTGRVLGGRGHKLPEAVRITFRDEVIENLCRSLVMIWNNSDKTVYGKNIVETDLLRINMGEKTKVLDTRIIKVTRPVNNCQVDLHVIMSDDVMWSEPVIKFDYLDSGDGLVVELFHTDTGEAPKLIGSIREMPRGFKDYKNNFPTHPFGKFMYVLSWAFAVALTVSAVVIVVSDNFASRSIILAITLMIFGGTFWYFSYAGAFTYRRRYPKVLQRPEFISA